MSLTLPQSFSLGPQPSESSSKHKVRGRCLNYLTE